MGVQYHAVIDAICNYKGCDSLTRLTGDTPQHCIRKLRQCGWVYNAQDGYAWCPDHADPSTRRPHTTGGN